MNKFISQDKNYLISELEESFRNIDIKFINLDDMKNYVYLKKESLLHNSVLFINKNFIKRRIIKKQVSFKRMINLYKNYSLYELSYKLIIKLIS